MASKILLVEDDNNLREIYEARLQAEGYAIVTAKDGEEALVVAKAEKPDLIISDVMMPRISGFEMLDILRNTNELKYTKVIMLTALGQADDKIRANSLGADRYLVKSQVTLEDIVRSAHELTDSPSPESPAAAAPAPVSVSAVPMAAAPPLTAAPAVPVQSPPVIPVAAAPAPSMPAPASPQAFTPPATPPAPQPVTPAPAYQPAPAPLSVTPPEPPQQFASGPAPVPGAPMSAVPTAPSVPPSAGMATPAVPPVSPRPAYMTDFSAAPQPAAPSPAPIQANPRPDTDQLNPATTAEEQAAVGAQIASFANQPAPGQASAVDTAPNASERAASSDDAVLAEAMSNLATDAEQPARPAATNPTITKPSTPIAVPAPSVPERSAASNGSVTIANKKTIQPIERESKPDLNELLAREEAKDITPPGYGPVMTAPAPITPSDSDGIASLPPQPQPGSAFGTGTPPGPQQPQRPPAANDETDPNNIAL